MEWFGYVLTIISAICTGFSIFGACKSITYFNKSKQINLYANTNIAYIESKKIIATLTEMLKLSNSKYNSRGRNISKELMENGECIKTSMHKIRESLSVADFNEVDNLLTEQQPKINSYIDSFITGSVLLNDTFVINDDFNKCQHAFCKMQLLLKERLENISEDLK